MLPSLPSAGRPGIRARSAAVSAAAASPAVTSPAVGAGCRAAAMTRPHRVRSRAAAVSSITTIRRRTVWVPVAGCGLPALGIGGDIPGQAVVHSGRRDRVVLFELLAHGIQRVVQP